MENPCFYTDKELNKAFWEMLPQAKEHIDFAIRWRKGLHPVLIIAPHGGFIEPGTSQLADAVADSTYWFYAFEGIKRSGNLTLRVPSTHFCEPILFKMVIPNVMWTLSIHGVRFPEKAIFIGGRDYIGGTDIGNALKEYGFPVMKTCPRNVAGINRTNIVNVNMRGSGVQLEIGKYLRNEVFQGTPLGYKLIEALKEGVKHTLKRFSM